MNLSVFRYTLSYTFMNRRAFCPVLSSVFASAVRESTYIDSSFSLSLSLSATFSAKPQTAVSGLRGVEISLV